MSAIKTFQSPDLPLSELLADFQRGWVGSAPFRANDFDAFVETRRAELLERISKAMRKVLLVEAESEALALETDQGFEDEFDGAAA